jgi:hypothetical protein
VVKIFSSTIIKLQEKLKSELEERGIEKNTVRKTLDSGYVAWNCLKDFRTRETEPCIMDCYYGSKFPSGIIDYDTFVDYLNGKKTFHLNDIKKYKVKSMRDVIDFLALPEYNHFSKRMCFRGQSKEYWMKRLIPNPFASNHEGKERFIAPSFWRQCKDVNNPALWSESSNPIWETGIADRLIYGDITKLSEEEAKKRYELHKLDLPYSRDYPTLEQHYGMKTINLDVTFDVNTAFFFASHQFHMNEEDKAEYLQITNGKHQGVVYCFVFESPPVYQTDFLIKKIRAFEHLKPIRPLRQQCGLVAFHHTEINAASRDLHAILLLDEDFNTTGLPEAEFLFPNKNKDQFYGALIEEKNRFRGFEYGNPWEEIVEYL